MEKKSIEILEQASEVLQEINRRQGIEEKKSIEVLEQISEVLQEMNRRQETEEVFSESSKLSEKSDRRVEHSLNQIQNSFDRIHDKAFNFNSILIGVYLVLGTFPSEYPVLNIWTVVFPIINLIYLIYIDIRQMEIHRFTSKEQEWATVERENYGKKINKQTLLSLSALVFSLACLVYVIIKLT